MSTLTLRLLVIIAAVLPTLSASSMASAALKLDIVLALDESGSVHPMHFFNSKTFLVELIGDLPFGPADVSAGLIAYGSTARTISGPTTIKSNLLNHISGVTQMGGVSDVTPALTLAETLLTTSGRPGAGRIIVLLNDGQSDDPALKLDELAAQGYDVFAVGVGDYDLSALSLPRNRGTFFTTVQADAARDAILTIPEPSSAALAVWATAALLLRRAARRA